MWDSYTGRLVRTLEGHEQVVYIVQFHPLNPTILFTAGYDGKCIFWDLESGAHMRTFYVNESEDDETNELPAGSAPSQESIGVKRASICDGQFSSDGMSFVVSDLSGGITVFGVDSVERTISAPCEQFFANEQMPIRRDERNRVIHETSGRLLHLEPKGLLCNKYHLKSVRKYFFDVLRHRR